MSDVMNAAVYDALREAGASEEKARAAARSVADYDARLARLEAGLTRLIWMVGLNLAGTLASLVRLFTH